MIYEIKDKFKNRNISEQKDFNYNTKYAFRNIF